MCASVHMCAERASLVSAKKGDEPQESEASVTGWVCISTVRPEQS